MNGIGFKNMKVFKERQWFDFSNITLLTGTNNSGKSSVINAMQMLQENLPNNSTIDNLLNTEFRLTVNQNKYGNIESFVNRSGKDKLNHFVFALKNNGLQYNILVEINEGLESYGTVKIISVTDPVTKEIIFHFELKSKHPNTSCYYKINFKYFINRFRKKCSNTLNLKESISELDKVLELVNKKEAKPADLYELANEIGNRLSVYINVHEITIDQELDNCEHTYFISNKPYDGVEKYQKIDELGVIFEYPKHKKTGMSLSGVISENNFNEKYLEFYNYGVFNFDVLLNGNKEAKQELDDLILAYYKLEKKDSYKALCDDLTTILSNTYWSMEERFSEEDELLVPANLIQKYLTCHPDFGLIASLLVTKRKDDKYGRKDFEGNYVANNYITAKKNVDFENAEVDKLEKNGFFDKVYSRLNELIFNNYNHNNEGANFENRSKIIHQDAGEFILKDIESKILNFNLGFNNTYVSSNRFQSKRSYNFSDNSDFTSLLKTIESLKGKSKDACLFFINKWIKEFEIADELVLKPDNDTGNFKAYLKIQNKDILLADFGLGTNQLLPIIFSLAIHYYSINIVTLDDEITKRTVVIEEPEANLHPAMQSKLADLFADAYKTFKVQIIVETHSEYLIRKLQYLAGSNSSEIRSDDILIYYFYKPEHQAVLNKIANQVEKIEIDEYGRLSKEFGSGFFDEADKIALDIFLLKHSQSN